MLLLPKFPGNIESKRMEKKEPVNYESREEAIRSI